MGNKRIEILVVVQQDKTVFQAAGCDQRIDRLAHRQPMTAKDSEISCGLDSDLTVHNIDHLKGSEELLGVIEIPIPLKPL